MLNNTLNAKGRVNVLLTDQYGNTKVNETYDNLVLTTGRKYIVDHMHEWVYPASAVTTGGVITTATAHEFGVGDEIVFTTLAGNTGPNITNTIYWVKSTGLTSTTFQISQTDADGAAVTFGNAVNLPSFRHRPNNVMAMALGTGAVAAATADTTITEIGIRKSGANLTVTKVTTGVTDDSIQYVASWGAGESTSATINEAGLFTGATAGATTGGLLLCRTVFAGTINKGASDTLTVTWKIQLTATGT